MKNIVVFFGGTSVERDVSVITGVLTLNSIDKKIYNPLPVYISGDGTFYTGESLFDIEFYKNIDYKKLIKVTFVGGSNVLYSVKGKKIKQLVHIAVGINCLHGERGEDGCVAGLMELCNIPFASPPLLSSSVCMDKGFTKYFLKGLGVKALPCVTVRKVEKVDLSAKGLSFPVIIKPARLGSSIGISKANDEKELVTAISTALRYGEMAVIEPCLNDFIEINCACYSNAEGEVITSECERPFSSQDFLSFDDKYSKGDREFPAKIPIKVSEKIKKVTAKVYSALRCEGIIRIDYMLVGDTVYLNEINTVPGSLAYYLFCDTMQEFSQILTEQIIVAERRFAVKGTFNNKYSSGVLNISGVKGGKRR